jgi:adenosylcobinamide kinase/adenosylcobinamide-phosphate guanylyltransferase
MRVTLLGTGSADGWPNPFCDCGSCQAERSDGRSRAPSSALIDDVILIDCGPTAPHVRVPAGGSLRTVEHVLVTHGHPDHLHPAFLLSRQWVSVGHVLHVWGPAGAMELCRHWLGPDPGVELHVIAPFAALDLATSAGTYRVDVLPAEHAHGDGDALAMEALLFVLTDPGGARLLYATDTGPLPTSTLDAMGGTLDLAIIDETFGDTSDHGTGHLDLTTLPRLIAELTDRNLVASSTVVVATHLSHHNPPTAILRQRLAHLGVRVADDLDTLDTNDANRSTTSRPVRHLVLGGARSGKSRFAEGLASTRHDVTYVATGGDRPDDAEWRERVAVHRVRRPGHWHTVETADVTGVIRSAPAGAMILVDCVTLWLTRHLDAMDAWSRTDRADRDAVRAEVDALTDHLVAALSASAADVVLVSNEVGMGIVPPTSSGRLFQDLLGAVNARLSQACSESTLVVAGRALSLTGPDQGTTP